jgi:hypothetical protein
MGMAYAYEVFTIRAPYAKVRKPAFQQRFGRFT